MTFRRQVHIVLAGLLTATAGVIFAVCCLVGCAMTQHPDGTVTVALDQTAANLLLEAAQREVDRWQDRQDQAAERGDESAEADAWWQRELAQMFLDAMREGRQAATDAP